MWGYHTVSEESRLSCMLEKSGAVPMWLRSPKCITCLIVKIVKKKKKKKGKRSHCLNFLPKWWKKSASGFELCLEKWLIVFNFRDSRCPSCSLKSLWELSGPYVHKLISCCCMYAGVLSSAQLIFQELILIIF